MFCNIWCEYHVIHLLKESWQYLLEIQAQMYIGLYFILLFANICCWVLTLYKLTNIIVIPIFQIKKVTIFPETLTV